MLQVIEAIRESLSKRWQEFWDDGLVTERMLQRYSEANDESLHSRLQGLLILAGWDAGLVAFPEWRLRLREPIDKHALGNYKARQRYQGTVKIDVGFFKQSNLVGIGEVVTLDMAHTSAPKLPSGITYYKLRHIARDMKHKVFFVIVVVLPRRILQAPSWTEWKEWHSADKEGKQAFVESLWKNWVRLSEELQSELGNPTLLMRATEQGLECCGVNPTP